MQVTQQKARRGQGRDKPPVERATQRVPPEVWLVEQPPGGFTYLTAGVEAMGQEVVSGTARGRGQFEHDSAGRSEPLPVVALTDGAKTIRCQWAELCGQPVPVLEFALLADGVAPGALYPLDVDRAFRFLESRKDVVNVWYKSPAYRAKAVRDPVAPAQRSELALDKVRSRTVDDGTPAHSFSTHTKNEWRGGRPSASRKPPASRG